MSYSSDMLGYLEDPSVLTKDKLKSELLANNVELPSGSLTKEVYVQLYLQYLTAQNKKSANLDAFSSDEELPSPVVSNRSRPSGRKATRKTDKARPEDLDVTELTAEGLKDELLKYGVNMGPIVVSTRKLYEKKLQKLLDQGPPQAAARQVVLAESSVNHNGNTDSDHYSDKEEVETAVPEPEIEHEPVPVLEVAPVVERQARSRGKPPVTARTCSSQHNRLKSLPGKRSGLLASKPPGSFVKETNIHPITFSPMCDISPIKNRTQSTASEGSPVVVEKIVAGDQTLKAEERDALKEMFSNDISSPSGISATCRRPIRGAAGRPLNPSNFWGDEHILRSPKSVNTTTTYTASRLVHRVNRLPPSASSSSRLVSVAPPAGQIKAARHSLSLWLKLFLLPVLAAFLFFVYQAMEPNSINPFGCPDTEQAHVVPRVPST